MLPEGSSKINAVVPFDVDQSFETKFTYLDTSGRPVLVLHKANVVPEHATKFHVDYYFGTLSMIHEPFLLISGGWAAVLVLVQGWRCSLLVQHLCVLR